MGKCPTCEKECGNIKENPDFPFCSDRCRLVDLWNWLNGEYGVFEPLPNVDEDPDKPDQFWRN